MIKTSIKLGIFQKDYFKINFNFCTCMPNLHVEPHFNAFSFFVNSFGQFGAEKSHFKILTFYFKCTRWSLLPWNSSFFFLGYFGDSRSTEVSLTWIKFAWSFLCRNTVLVHKGRSFNFFFRLGSLENNNTWVWNFSFWKGNWQLLYYYFSIQIWKLDITIIQQISVLPWWWN